MPLRVILSRSDRRDQRRAAAWLPPPERGSATNPYPTLLYAALAEHGIPRADFGDLGFTALWRARRSVRFLHFNWRPDRCYAPCLGVRSSVDRTRLVHARLQLCRFALLLAWARLLGFRIVWTVHEVRPPREGAAVRVDLSGLKVLARASTLRIAHNRATAARLQDELGMTLSFEIVPHGTFEGVYPSRRPASELRTALGIPDEAFVFLSFGQVRADKHLELLLEGFAAVATPGAQLVVAGVPAHPPSRRLAEVAARSDDRIRLMLEQVSDEGVAELFGIADAFVLPRSEVWTSGSLVLALSMGVPAVAARLGPNVDLLGADAAGWLFEPGDAESLADALRLAASDPVSTAEKRATARIRRAALPSWDEVAGQMTGLFADATGYAPNGAPANLVPPSPNGRSKRAASAPTLGVIIPAPDPAPFLSRCLRAIAAADDPPEQTLVVDERELSVIEARNAGARRTRADVLVFIDSDVLVHVDAFTRIRRGFADDAELGALFGIYDDRPPAPGAISGFRNLLHHHVGRSSAGEAQTFWTGLGAVRRDVFEAAGGFVDELRWPRRSRERRDFIADVSLGVCLAEAGRRIVLDPEIQGTHLKRWSFSHMLYTDFLVRGVPWVRLLLRRRRAPHHLNLGWRHRISALLSLGVPVVLVRRRLSHALLLLSGLVAINRSFYALLLRRRGAREALVGVLMHVLHHLISVASVVAGVLIHVTERPRPRG